MDGHRILREIDTLLPEPPADWPWALPDFYCVAVMSDPGDEIVGYCAHKDGTGEARLENVKDRTRVILVGYWHDQFAVVESRTFLRRDQAERAADSMFKQMRIRFKVRDGNVVWQNPSVDTSGRWPTQWRFQTTRDLGVLCAFLYEILCDSGHSEQAQKLKESLHRVMPGREMANMFRSALANVKNECTDLLTDDTLSALQRGLTQADLWAGDVRL
jgi:hypothetical protein